MNKIIVISIILIIGIFALTGCGAGLDIDKITENVKSLNTETINSMQPVQNLADYEISVDNLEAYCFYINTETMDMWTVLKPKQDKTDAVKSEMDDFIASMSLNNDLKVVSKYSSILKDEYNGYLIYIATATENSEILAKIKN